MTFLRGGWKPYQKEEWEPKPCLPQFYLGQTIPLRRKFPFSFWNLYEIIGGFWDISIEDWVYTVRREKRGGIFKRYYLIEEKMIIKMKSSIY